MDYSEFKKNKKQQESFQGNSLKIGGKDKDIGDSKKDDDEKGNDD